MNVLILGSGALGSLLGSRLSRVPTCDLSLLTTNRDHVRAISRKGLTVEELDESKQIYRPLKIYDDPTKLRKTPDLVLVLVKTYATEQAIKSVDPICSKETLFLTLQNGLGNWEKISEIVGKDRVLVGTTTQGATFVAPGCVRNGGEGKTFVGEMESTASDRARNIVDLFKAAGLEAVASDDMQSRIWEKVIINIGINPVVTALDGKNNGLILSNKIAQMCSIHAMAEAICLAEKLGIRTDEKIIQKAFNVAKATATNKNSMLQDIERGRPTEIDALCGTVVEQGKKLGLPVRANQLLLDMIKERTHRNKIPDAA